MSPKRPVPRRIARVERALNDELRDRPSESPNRAARAALRTLAHALDVAEARGDTENSAKVGRVYVDTLVATGLIGPPPSEPATDPFTAFVAGLSTPAVGDTPDT